MTVGDLPDRLEAMAAGYAVSADAERAIMEAFTPARERFDAGSRDDGDMRRVREYCRARDDAKRYDKEGADLRDAAARIRSLEGENARLISDIARARASLNSEAAARIDAEASLAKAVEGLRQCQSSIAGFTATEGAADRLFNEIQRIHKVARETLASIRQEPKPYDAKEHEGFYP